jgi:hypothetical protein
MNGPTLNGGLWAIVVLVNALVLVIFVRYILGLSRPAKRMALHGGILVSSLLALMFVALLYHWFDEGYVPLDRKGAKAFFCSDPDQYWAMMALQDLVLLGLVALSVSCWIRLRRPYRKYRKYVDLVE